MAGSLLEALDLVDWAKAGLAGWRYLFFASFRRKTHQRWKLEGTGRVVWDVICGLAGVAFTLLVLFWLVDLTAVWGPATGYWSCNGIISYWGVPNADVGSTSTWAELADAEGIDAEDWALT